MDANDLADGFCEWVKQDEARDIDSPEFRDELARLFECIHAEARAAIFADEERRVWCEAYLWTRLSGWKEPSALRRGDRALAAWREARAAWGARDER